MIQWMNFMSFERLNITLPKDTYQKLHTLADKEDRSLSNMISFLINNYKK